MHVLVFSVFFATQKVCLKVGKSEMVRQTRFRGSTADTNMGSKLQSHNSSGVLSFQIHATQAVFFVHATSILSQDVPVCMCHTRQHAF
jgi:hypothetical protein